MSASTYEPEGVWVTSPDDPRLVVLWAAGVDYPEEDGLGFVLNVARTQCAEFAPTLGPDDPIPDHYVAAQVMQARALVQAGIVGPGDQAGGYGDAVTVFPMDWAVKNLLRPRRGRPYFGGRRAS